MLGSLSGPVAAQRVLACKASGTFPRLSERFSCKSICRQRNASAKTRYRAPGRSVPSISLSTESDRSLVEMHKRGPKNSNKVMVLLGIGFGLGFLGLQESAKAFGPEGPLVEEFWENMTRYAVYFVTVATGALYTVLKPVVELLRSPLSAFLILVIIGGSFYLLYITLNAMFGLSEFSYQYAS